MQSGYEGSGIDIERGFKERERGATESGICFLGNFGGEKSSKHSAGNAAVLLWCAGSGIDHFRLRYSMSEMRPKTGNPGFLRGHHIFVSFKSALCV